MKLKNIICAGASASSVLLMLHAAKLPSHPDLIDYAYTIDRRDTEKRSGLLKDGDTSTGARWHTKFGASTSVICELKESHTIDLIEINVPKYTKWYIINELHVAVDDGFGGFGEPIVIPGYERSPGKGPLRDASCTNHVFSAKGLGKAIRVKVTVKSNAAAGINEIRLFGKRQVQSVSPDRSPAMSGNEMKNILAGFRRLENRYWRLAFNPVGGRIMSLYSKAIDRELTSPNREGTFTEEVWDRRRSRRFLIGQPFAMTYEKGDGDSMLATATGNAQGGGIDFLKVIKRYSATGDSTALRVDYRFENIPEAMALQNYAPLLHATLGVYGRDVTCYYPTTEGVVAIAPGKRGNEYWGHRPARGWMAAVTDDGTGVAITMPFRDLKTFYSWFSQVPTLEWRMIPVGLEAGTGYDVSTEVIPFKGLKKVSGAGGGFVGSLGDGACTIISSRAGEVTAVAGEKSRVLRFDKPGASVRFSTEVSTVVLRRGDKEVCRLEACPASGAWTLQKTCMQRESSVAEVDLTCYTNFTPSVCNPWAKPLHGRRLKVSVVTGNGNLIEVGRIADRFDFDFRTIGVGLVHGRGKKRTFGNPIFSDGDNFSLINTEDLERGVMTVLKYDSDVILIGGVPFEAFTKELREQLLSRVKGGTSLVWIGLDHNVPELGFKLKKGRIGRGTPKSKTSLFDSVPFALFGGEDVYPIEVPPDGIVHASCSDRPYLFETRLGKGRIFHVAYRANTHPPWAAPGLTPAGLRDFYETKEAPADQYYSMIAKALLAAAGRTMPISFNSVEVTGERSVIGISAKQSGRTDWNWRVTDPYGRVVASGSRKTGIPAGTHKVTIDGLSVPRTQGPLLFELSVRDENGAVLNWGAWKFEHAPKAEIASLRTDARWLREGDTVSFTADVTGDSSGMRLAVSLVDSYGRTLDEQSPVPGRQVKGTFRISNELPARCYTVEGRLYDDAGAQVSRRRVELRVRPGEGKYAWDDFEVGTWASANNREYLWPGLADIYRRIGVSTIIANPPRMQKDFTMRYNIHPTLLSGAGLHRCAEPDAYSKTGDKMKLARPTCLSSPEFFEGRRESLKRLAADIPRYGMRFVWFGDEQSITGYGGTPVDFCFSEHCLKEMRNFAKMRYGTLERLNEEWETEFPDWDSVVPFTRQEVWAAEGRHVAGWSDHLEFMDSRLTNTLAFSVNRIREADPAVRFAISGTQRPSAYGGMDWWKELNVLDAALNYGDGGQFDIHRSFCPNGGLMSWNWGYSSRGGAAVARVWRTAFYGMRGLMGFQSTSQINQDWSFSRGLRDTLPHVRRLVEGTGKHFVNNLVAKHEVAILYSQASLRAAFIENRRNEHDQLEEKVRRLLRNLGYSYDYVSYEELAAGGLAAGGYRALVLADAVAMSDAEIAGVKAFAAGGGTVIAEGMPATRRSNCRVRTVAPLAGLFVNGSRHALFSSIDVRYLKAVKYPAKPENAPVVEMERKRYGDALVRAGVSTTRLDIVDDDTALPIVNVETFAKSDVAGHPMWGVLASHDEKPRDVRFTFPKKGWVYDLVSGRSYGEVEKLRLPLAMGIPYAFVQFGENVDLKQPVVNGSRIDAAYSRAVDGVVRVEVFRPDGSEAYCYAKNVLLKKGKGSYVIPFAPSDPRGKWKVRVSSVFGNVQREACVLR